MSIQDAFETIPALTAEEVDNLMSQTMGGGPAGPGSPNWWLNPVNTGNTGSSTYTTSAIGAPNTGNIAFGPSTTSPNYTYITPATWATTTTPYIVNSNIPSNGMQVNGKLTADDIEVGGTNLAELLKGIQERLSILIPDPAKMEKYAALKAAYEHYKTLEALCREDDKPQG